MSARGPIGLLGLLHRQAQAGNVDSLAVIIKNKIGIYTFIDEADDDSLDDMLVGSVALTKQIRKRRKNAKASR